MAAIGILLALVGFALSIFSLSMEGVAIRMVLVLAGIAVSLFGILGLVNRAYMQKANWRK